MRQNRAGTPIQNAKRLPACFASLISHQGMVDRRCYKCYRGHVTHFRLFFQWFCFFRAYYGIFYTKSWAPFFLIIVWALSLSSALLDLSFFSFEWRIMNDLSSFYTIIDTLILSLVLFSPASSYYQNELYSNKQNGEILWQIYILTSANPFG